MRRRGHQTPFAAARSGTIRRSATTRRRRPPAPKTARRPARLRSSPYRTPGSDDPAIRAANRPAAAVPTQRTTPAADGTACRKRMTPSPPQTPVPRHPTGAIPERLPLQIEQQPGEHLFIDHRIGFQTVGRHVIDRFDEKPGRHRSRSGSRSAPRAPQDGKAGALPVAQRRIVGIDGQRIGRRLLAGITDPILHPERAS